jgi:hypothetical protein
MDVPLLCSPVPFQNAALSAPEVCKMCKQGFLSQNSFTYYRSN